MRQRETERREAREEREGKKVTHDTVIVRVCHPDMGVNVRVSAAARAPEQRGATREHGAWRRRPRRRGCASAALRPIGGSACERAAVAVGAGWRSETAGGGGSKRAGEREEANELERPRE